MTDRDAIIRAIWMVVLLVAIVAVASAVVAAGFGIHM